MNTFSRTMLTAALVASPTALSARAISTGPTEDPPEPALCAPYVAFIEEFYSVESDEAMIASLAGEAESVAPDDVAEPLGVVLDAIRGVVANPARDWWLANTDEFAAARSELNSWIFERCRFDTKLEVTASEYRFSGIPEEIPAGTVAFLLVDAGNEVHEIVVLRRLEGVTESFEELAELGWRSGAAIAEKVEAIGAAATPSPDAVGLVTGNLAPGEYAALCFVAQGMTFAEDGDADIDGDPHFRHGMIFEFTVTG